MIWVAALSGVASQLLGYPKPKSHQRKFPFHAMQGQSLAPILGNTLKCSHKKKKNVYTAVCAYNLLVKKKKAQNYNLQAWHMATGGNFPAAINSTLNNS